MLYCLCHRGYPVWGALLYACEVHTMIDLIIQYESGELDQDQTVALFASLVKSGLAWSLQGHYGRTAHQLIEAGYISSKGEVLS